MDQSSAEMKTKSQNPHNKKNNPHDPKHVSLPFARANV